MMVARSPGPTASAAARNASGAAARACSPWASVSLQLRTFGWLLAASIATTTPRCGRSSSTATTFASCSAVETIATFASEFSRMKRHCWAMSVE